MDFGLTTIYLIRHGDEKELAKKLENIDISAVYSSAAKDAKNVAQTIANQKKILLKTSPKLNKPTIKTLEGKFKKLISFLQDESQKYENKTFIIITHGQFIRKFLVAYKYGSEKEFAPGSVENGGYLKLESNGHDFFATETYKIHLIEEKM